MTLSQKVAFNTAIQIASKIITVGLTLVTTILLTSYLGKEGYGEYIYVITLAILFGALADWGTLTIGVREASKEKKNQGLLLANIFFLRLILSLVAAFLLFIFAFLVPSLRTAIGIASLIVILVALKASFVIVFQSRLEMHKAALADITTSFLILLFSWSVIRQGLGLGPLIWSVVWASALAALVAAVLAIKTIKYKFSLDKKIMTKIISESLPMGAILLMFTMDNKIDTVMLGLLKGSGAVGIYGVAYRIYDVIILGAAYLMNALLPVISQFFDLNKWRGKLQKIYQEAFDVLLLMGVGIFVIIWFFAPLIIRILTQQRFGEFIDSANILRILALAMLIAYFNHLTGYTIVALGKQRTYFWIALTSLVFNIIVNLIFIPRFSYWGAAWMTVLTEVLVLAITLIFVFRLIGIFPSLVEFPRTVLKLIKNKGKIF